MYHILKTAVKLYLIRSRDLEIWEIEILLCFFLSWHNIHTKMQEVYGIWEHCWYNPFHWISKKRCNKVASLFHLWPFTIKTFIKPSLVMAPNSAGLLFFIGFSWSHKVLYFYNPSSITPSETPKPNTTV